MLVDFVCSTTPSRAPFYLYLIHDKLSDIYCLLFQLEANYLSGGLQSIDSPADFGPILAESSHSCGFWCHSRIMGPFLQECGLFFLSSLRRTSSTSIISPLVVTISSYAEIRIASFRPGYSLIITTHSPSPMDLAELQNRFNWNQRADERWYSRNQLVYSYSLEFT